MNKSVIVRLLRIAALTGAFALLGLTAGCVEPAEPGGAGLTFVDGILATTLKADLSTATAAAGIAIDRLGLTRAGESRDELTDTLVLRSAANRRIEIKLEYAGAALTRVTIQVGSFGDRPLSVAILEKIKAGL